jgi:large subunit ribosomal protein L18
LRVSLSEEKPVKHLLSKIIYRITSTKQILLAMNNQDTKKRRQLRRKLHIRKKIFGTSEEPRLTVKRSLKHIYAQIIDDTQHMTIVSASTLDKEVLASITKGMKKVELSKLVGAYLAKKAIEKNIKKVAFDRNGYLYHGRVKVLADAAREGGLKF